MTSQQKIRRAFLDAQSRRPYRLDAEIVAAATPLGGEWFVIADVEKMRHQVMWHHARVADVDPDGRLDRRTSADIAMALGATPTMDCALRVIIVLAESGENLALIRTIAESVIAYIERPAPKLPTPPEETDEAEEGVF